MNILELKQLSKEELAQRLLESRQKLHHIHEEVASGKDKNHAQMGVLRKDIARVKTCISDKNNS